MVIGVAVIELHVEASQSLKAKRGVVRSIAGRLRNTFNVSVAEVGGQGTWQRATIGLSMTGNDATAVRRTLRRAVDFVEETHLAQVLDSDVDTIRISLAEGAGMPLGDDAGGDWPWRDEDDPADGEPTDGAGEEDQE